MLHAESKPAVTEKVGGRDDVQSQLAQLGAEAQKVQHERPCIAQQQRSVSLPCGRTHCAIVQIGDARGVSHLYFGAGPGSTRKPRALRIVMARRSRQDSIAYRYAFEKCAGCLPLGNIAPDEGSRYLLEG